MKGSLGRAIIGMLLAGCAGIAQADNFSPFTAETFAQVKESYDGEPFLVSLWSVSCLPCRAELEMLGELKAARPDFPLVMISIDPIETREEATYILEEYGLEKIDSWMFADGFV
jgi:thiol-disulfide isomerase/thioredoxin